MDAVVEGAVQRSGLRIRLSVRLVDAADGSTRWSETYDREAKDFFAVEDEIGRAVAGGLSLFLTGRPMPAARHQTTIAKAYDLYLRGRHQRELRTDTAFKQAIHYFSEAIAADSNYAAAWAGLSEACTSLAFSTNSAEFPRSKLLACSEAAARKALQLDDSLRDPLLPHREEQARPAIDPPEGRLQTRANSGTHGSPRNRWESPARDAGHLPDRRAATRCAKRRDPRRQQLVEVFTQWWAHHIDEPVKVSELSTAVTMALDPQHRGRQVTSVKVV